MSTKKRKVIFGGRIIGTEIRDEQAWEAARKVQRVPFG